MKVSVPCVCVYAECVLRAVCVCKLCVCGVGVGEGVGEIWVSHE